MSKKRIRVGNVIMCEYAAKGDRNKHNLVNVYSGNVRFDELPAEFSFGLYIELPAQGLKQLKVSLRMDNEEFLSADARSSDDRNGTIVIPLVKLRVDGPGTITVHLEGDEFAVTKVLSKRLYVTDPDA